MKAIDKKLKRHGDSLVEALSTATAQLTEKFLRENDIVIVTETRISVVPRKKRT